MPQRPLRILFLQDSPCIRNYKYAKALQAHGHSITLAYTKRKLSERYPGMNDDVYAQCVLLRDWPHLWELCAQHDIVHSHNEPDTLTVAALAGDTPVVHDTHDLISLRDAHKPDLGYFEGIANRGADGRIYSTPYQQREAARLYGAGEPSLVVYNYISRDDRPTRFLPKLSAQDGQVHIVYEGGFGGPQHRRFENIFTGLAELGVHVHIYPAAWKQEQADMLAPWPLVHYHRPVSPQQIMEQMTQYDFGIIPWNIIPQNKRFLDSTVANKLFEYLAAGLPVFASPIESYVEYFASHPVGLTFTTPQELVSSIDRMRTRTQGVKLTDYAESYEDHIEAVEAFYHMLVERGRAPRRRTAHADAAAATAVPASTAQPSVQSDMLYVAFMDTRFAHIMGKMARQAAGLQADGLHVEVHVLGRATAGAHPQLPVAFHPCSDEAAQLRTFEQLLRQLRPRLVFVRYQGKVMASEGFARLAREHGNFVYESQTKKPVELRLQRSLDHLQREERWGPELLRAARGLVGITPEIVEYDRRRAGRADLPALAIGNGIDVANVPARKGQPYTGGPLMVLMAASFDNWHGVDRLLQGLQQAPQLPVILNLVGGGGLYEAIKQYVQQHGLQERVRLPGWLEGDELDRLVGRCHVAIGSLALHRIELRQAAVLKVRNYLARGLPVVIGYDDVDLPDGLPFVWRVPSDDTPLDMHALRAFALRAYAQGDPGETIRAFARQHLDWAGKMHTLAGFLRQLMNEQPAAQPTPQPPAKGNSGAPRILFVCHDFPPHRYAGAQLYARNLAKKLNETGLAQVDVLYPVFRRENQQDYTIRESRFEGLRVFELAKPSVNEPQKVFDEKMMAPVHQFLQQQRYDAIHVHGLGQITPAPVQMARKLNIPLVATLHDYWMLCDHWHLIRTDQSQCSGPESAQKCAQCFLEDYAREDTPKLREQALKYHTVRREIMQQVFAAYNRVFAPSAYLAGRFAEFGFTGIEVAPLGFEYDEIVPGRPEDGLFHFGYTGQLIPRKGVNFLIEALMSLPHQNARLHIHGPHDKPYGARLKELAAADSRIVFHGRYDPEQLDAIYRTIDMAVVPSLMENYPLVVQEAFLRHTPVIATRVGGIPEVLRDDENGLLVAAESADAILKAMIRVLAAPDCVERYTAAIQPVRRLEEDARHYAGVYAGVMGKKPQPEKPIVAGNALRVQFYVAKNVHWAMFRELFQYLHAREDVSEVVICLPDLVGMTTVSSQRANLEELLKLPARFVSDPRAIPVDVTFIADAIAGKVKGAGKVVNIGHGTISKGYYFTRGVWTERQNWVDLLCVPGSHALEQLQSVLSTSVVATGMPKLDPAFGGRVDISAVRTKLGIAQGRKVVLYAPTFNQDLSSVYDFAERLPELADADYDLIIKLHGTTVGQLAAHYEQLAARTPSFHFATGDDLTPLLALADVMISDVSSAWMEFMALDKPVILYNNPRAKDYHGYDPANIEWAWRELGTQVNSFDELKSALPRILREGDGKQALRQQYAARLFATREGNACSNVWQATLCALRQPGSRQPETVTLAVRCNCDNLLLVRDQIYAAQSYAALPLELVVLRTDDDPEVTDWLHEMRTSGWFMRVKSAREGEKPLMALVRGQMVVWLHEETLLFKNYDYLLHRTFAANPDVAVLASVTDDPARGGEIPPEIDPTHQNYPSRFAFEFAYRYEGREVGFCRSTQPGLLAIWPQRLPAGTSDPLALANELAVRGELPVALSVYTTFYYPEEISVIHSYWQRRGSLPATERYELGLEILDHVRLSGIALEALKASVELRKPERWGHLMSILFAVRFHDVPLRRQMEKLFAFDDGIAAYHRRDRELVERLRGAAPSNEPAQPLRIAPQQPARPRVLFYFFKNVHIPILQPIVQEVKRACPQAEIAFGIMPRRPDIRAGFEPHEESLIHQMGEKVVPSPQAFRPHVTFIADSIYGIVQGCGKVVHVGHGVLSKGQYYTDTPLARREQQADLVCVPGSWHAQALQRVITKPVVATGMAKLDAAFRGELTRENVLAHYGLPADKRYVLYAPTFNDELSSLEMVGSRLGEVLPPGALAIVKLHGSTAASWKQFYRDLVQREPRIIFADGDELDITPFLVLADVLVSDVSSAMMEFAALDKPVVLYDNPRWAEYEHYHPEDIDFCWRDIGLRVTSLDEMRQAVARSMEQPGELSETRLRYADQLFANRRDGLAAQRIVKAAMQVAGIVCEKE